MIDNSVLDNIHSMIDSYEGVASVKVIISFHSKRHWEVTAVMPDDGERSRPYDMQSVSLPFDPLSRYNDANSLIERMLQAIEDLLYNHDRSGLNIISFIIGGD